MVVGNAVTPTLASNIGLGPTGLLAPALGLDDDSISGDELLSL